ncbi:MAG: zinc metallopeptidase [Akkermansia sp.]|nr:zinc metallopeptidase [Akkermansia sp.]MBR2313243.1 zinc metallopeptidase [Akkermansia sp.]
MIDIPYILAQASYYYGGGSDYGYTGMYSGVTFIGMAILLVTMLIGGAVQMGLKNAFNRYTQEPAPLTGAEAARRMLQQFGLSHVQVVSVEGRLTDHYNPLDRTVNLSQDVYNEASVAAIAVAAHECGHAIQHARAYPWLGLRSSLVPMVNIGSRLGQIVLMLGFMLLAAGSGTTVAWIGLALYAMTTLFALVTLPVEFDASRRALAWLESSGLADRVMHGQAGTALRWAAMTYVAAALSSLAMLLYYALIILSRAGGNRE